MPASHFRLPCAIAVSLIAAPAYPEAERKGSRALLLEPMAAAALDKTHAAMVVSKRSFGDVTFSAEFATLRQLRKGDPPNAWETAWAVFHYEGDERFYYLALKTEGWELGKADPAYPGAQRFLATGSDPAFRVGQSGRFEIETMGPRITVRIDGREVATFTDEERPYLSGKVGFYTEDARVAFDDVRGSLQEDFESYGDLTLKDGGSIGDAWSVVYLGYGSGEVGAWRRGN